MKINKKVRKCWNSEPETYQVHGKSVTCIIICVSFPKCRVTIWLSLPGTVLIHACCTGMNITSSPFHSLSLFFFELRALC
jgi:hypothetical protein